MFGRLLCALFVLFLTFVYAQSPMEIFHLHDEKCRTRPALGRAYEQGRCFADYRDVHKIVSCNSTHVKYEDGCNSDCSKCDPASFLPLPRCGGAFGFSVRSLCQPIPAVSKLGFYYKSFETKKCKEKFKPTIFIENEFCYSRSQQKDSKNPISKLLNTKSSHNSVRMFWNLEKNHAQFEFFKMTKCQGRYDQKFT
eukprot:gene8587-412_t